MRDTWHIGEEFFRWEMAVAVAGVVIGIDPFDQPDVEASKEKTRALMDAYDKSHRLPTEEPVFSEKGVALYADPRNANELGRHDTLAGYLKAHLGRARAGDYVALLAYIQRSEAHTRALTAIRTRIRDRTHAATCLGFGPRFQHSTGQAYKGGPNSGVFLQITCDDPSDSRRPRPFLQLRRGEGGAGARRSGGAGGTREARAARPPEGCRRGPGGVGAGGGCGAPLAGFEGGQSTCKSAWSALVEWAAIFLVA